MILSQIWNHVSHKMISFHKIPPPTFLLSTNVANSLSLDLWVWWIWIFSGPKNKLIDLEELITSTPQTLLQCAVLFNSCCLHFKKCYIFFCSSSSSEFDEFEASSNCESPEQTEFHWLGGAHQGNKVQQRRDKVIYQH